MSMETNKMHYILLVIVVIILSSDAASRPGDLSLMNQIVKSSDKGKFTNCGKTNFSLEFTPTTIKVNTVMKAWLSLVPETPMSSGTLSVTLTVPGVPDPIYKQQLEFDCGDIDPYVKGVCPFKPGVPVKGVFNYTVPERAHTVDIPTGQYHVKGEIRNQFTDLFVCGETDVTIINPQMDK